MIKKLQKKFILITMIIVTCVVFAIVFGINIVNYLNADKETNKIVNIIVNNNGFMPKPNFKSDVSGGETGEMPKDFEKNNLSLETPFTTRYFTVVVGRNGIVVNTENIYSVSKDEAISCANAIKDYKKTIGFYNNYKYSISQNENGTLYVFVDCEQELSIVRSTLFISSMVGLGAILVIFVLIVIFSKVAVRPIAESYEKQKRFITDANHEIKTPLTIISATNEILEMKYGENEWTNTIQNQVKRLSELTEKLILLSKMEEDNEKIVINNVALSSTIKECAEEFKILAKSQNKQYIIDVSPNIEGKAEPNLIKRLVSILLDNAFKYTKENDTISITFSSVGRNKKLTVKNTIDNIQKGNLENIFERFYRLDSSRNSETGGSGIGLSVAKAISNIHNGKITAKSEDGKSIQIDFIF